MLGQLLDGVGPEEQAALIGVWLFGLGLAIFSDGAALSASARGRGGRGGRTAWLLAIVGELFTQTLALGAVDATGALLPGADAGRLLVYALLPVGLLRIAFGARLCRRGSSALVFALGAGLPWLGALAVRLAAGGLLALAGVLFLCLLLVGQLAATPPRPPRRARKAP